MYISKNLAVIIPARAGSKRLLNKNRSMIGGVSLLERTYLTVKSMGFLGSTIFTTDDTFLHKQAIELGLFSPELRPPELCLDNSSSISVVKYALEIHKRRFDVLPDITILLQLTSPFRRPNRIYNAVEVMRQDAKYGSVFSASYSAIKSFKTMSDRLPIDILNKNSIKPNKRLKFINANGNFYISRTSFITNHSTLFGSMAGGIITSDAEAMDIDDEMDLRASEQIAKKLSI